MSDSEAAPIQPPLPEGAQLNQRGRVSRSQQALRRRVGELLAEDDPPDVLRVVNTILSDVMAGPQPGPAIEHGNSYDWLLAMGNDKLGLIRVPPGRPMRSELVAAPAYDSLKVSVEDHGELDRRRMFLLTLADGSWIALGTRIRRRHGDLDRFTDELLRRTVG